MSVSPKESGGGKILEDPARLWSWGFPANPRHVHGEAPPREAQSIEPFLNPTDLLLCQSTYQASRNPG